MDFLKIRKKAKERRSGRTSAAERGVARPVEPEPTVPEPGPQPQDGRGGAPEPEPAAAGAAEAGSPQDADPRFTTWRPGTGARPVVPSPEPVAPRPESADFTVYEPVRAPPPEAPAPPAPPREAPAPVSAPRAAAPLAAPPAPPPAPRAAGGSAASAQDPLDEFFFREDEEVSALAALPADAEPEAVAEDVGVEEYLTFRLGVEEYAVAIERVREVLKSLPVTEVPRAPAGILGVITVRGDVVAVFDPRRRLGLPGRPPPDGVGRVVIVDDGEGPCGLLVDDVANVVRLPRGSIEPCPQGIGGASADCLAGIGRERSRLFTVLDLGALLRRAPATSRGGAVHARE